MTLAGKLYCLLCGQSSVGHCAGPVRPSPAHTLGSFLLGHPAETLWLRVTTTFAGRGSRRVERTGPDSIAEPLDPARSEGSYLCTSYISVTMKSSV